MRTIYKYPLAMDDDQLVTMHNPTVIRHVGFDGDNNLCIWGEVDTTTGFTTCQIHIRGTGHPLPEQDCVFLGSAVDPIRGLVWHVFVEWKE